MWSNIKSMLVRIEKYMERPGDGPTEREQRRILVPVCVMINILQGGIALFESNRLPVMYHLGLAFGSLATMGGWVVPLLRLNVKYPYLVSAIMLMCCASVLTMDLAEYAVGRARVWSMVVIVMDLLLVFKTSLQPQLAVLVMTWAWLTVVAVEEMVAFGLFQYVGLLGEKQPVPPVCDCASPPCTLDPYGSLHNWAMIVTVLLADYYITRFFSVNLSRQLEQNTCSVRVAERVAGLLAAYATDDARRVVGEDGASLPVPLRDSYLQLLDNLDSYRVFLPDSLLLAAHGDSPSGTANDQETRGTRPPPGLGEESVSLAVCFTDIQSSTELWEAFPQGMYESLNLHNACMRLTYSACNGYEVKTIGDSFMVAFDTGIDALRFGLEAQQGLLRQNWPEDLLTHPLCLKVDGPGGEPLWGGLRVRVGVQSGPVRVERNPVTGRCDYFGSTVNTAARLEAVLRKGGLVATSDSVVSALGEGGLRELGSPVLHDEGDRELKGVKERVLVWALVPRQLAQRFSVLSSDINTPPPRTCSGEVRRVSPSLGSSGSSKGQMPLPFAGGSLLGASNLRAAKEIALRLQRSVATCAVARLALWQAAPVGERHPAFVAAAALAADRTLGVVDTVLSSCVVVTWNASRSCTDRTAACRKFLGTAFRSQVHLGAASGGVLHGSVSAGRRSFAVVTGGCVEFAAALAEEAERCGDRALAAGDIAAECAAVRQAHCAQLWQPTGAPAVVVHAIDTNQAYEETWLFCDLESQGGSQRWGDEIAALFRQACAVVPGSAEQEALLVELQKFVQEDGSPRQRQREAQLLADRVAGGWVRTRLMPPQWEPREAE